MADLTLTDLRALAAFKCAYHLAPSAAGWRSERSGHCPFMFVRWLRANGRISEGVESVKVPPPSPYSFSGADRSEESSHG